jgi:hypothetical protein
MKSAIAILLSVLQQACSPVQVNSDSPSSGDSLFIVKSVDSIATKIPAQDTTYEGFRMLFKKAELPYSFHTDSIDQVGYPEFEGIIYDDTPGVIVRKFIPPAMLKKWLSDTSYSGYKSNLVKHIADTPGFFDCPNAFCWATMDAFVRFEFQDKEVFLVIENSLNGGGKYGRLELLAITFRDRKLTNIQEIGTYGWHFSNYMHDPEYYPVEGKEYKDQTGWSKETMERICLQVAVNSVQKVKVVKREETKVDLQEYWPKDPQRIEWGKRDTSYVIKKRPVYYHTTLE